VTIRSQIEILREEGVEHVVVGGQAGVLRRAIEFSHDLDILVAISDENATRTAAAVRRIAHTEVDPRSIVERDFQQYVAPDGEEIDVHLRLVAIASYDVALRNASEVDFLGLPVTCLELPALYASKRTDRPKDAVHRQEIEARARQLVMDREWAVDEIVLALSLDASLMAFLGDEAVRPYASTTAQPLLQARLLSLGLSLEGNGAIHDALRPVLSLPHPARSKILEHPGRFAAVLARLPLLLPDAGWQPRRP
jgi:hypothetical protein